MDFSYQMESNGDKNSSDESSFSIKSSEIEKKEDEKLNVNIYDYIIKKFIAFSSMTQKNLILEKTRLFKKKIASNLSTTPFFRHVYYYCGIGAGDLINILNFIYVFYYWQ